MPESIFVISGRITRRDTHAGIHGLRVEAWDEDRRHDDYLGVDLTNRDGSFLIRFSESKFKTFVGGSPEVFLRIRDRDCRLIYDGGADRHRSGPGTPIAINVELDPDALQWHLQRPVSWTEIGGPLVPDAGDKGPMVVSLWGDMMTEPNGFFIKLPAGDKGMMHTHTND